ncbi:hypothetical protein Q5A_022285 [Serratia inhibens PRI-2C]|nr:hypothetical protein Q5A_022285 [Serratia inhibens PRI-2C]
MALMIPLQGGGLAVRRRAEPALRQKKRGAADAGPRVWQCANQLRNGLPLSLRAGWVVVIAGAEARVATGAGAAVCDAGALSL